MPGRVAGKVALITGGSRGQGAAEARLFAREGAHVVIGDVLDADGEALAASIRDEGYRAAYAHLDVADGANWESALGRVKAECGGLHILVNNAGVSHRLGIVETSVEDWERVLQINLTGAWLGMKYAAPVIRAAGGGAIVNVSSIAGLTGYHAAAYTASKWGLRGLTKVAAMEFVDWGIRVNSIHPGLIETPMTAGSQKFMAAMNEVTPMGRAGTAEEVATLALFLSSDEASFITGAEVTVDGGLTAGAEIRQLTNRLGITPRP